MSGGKSEDQEVEVKPFGAAKPLIKDIIRGLRGEVGNLPEYFPDSTVAPIPESGQLGLNQGIARALAGNPLLGMSQDALSEILGGGSLGSSPASGILEEYLSATNPALAYARANLESAGVPGAGFEGLVDTASGANLDVASRPDFQNFQRLATENLVENVLPRGESTFGASGRLGSGLARANEQDLIEAFGREIGGAGAQLYGQERGFQQAAQLGLENLGRGFQQDRLSATGQFGGIAGSDLARGVQGAEILGRLGLGGQGQLLSAIQSAPGLSEADFNDINRLLGFSGIQQGQNQQEIMDEFQRYMFGETGPGSTVGHLQNIAGTAIPLAGVGQTQSISGGGASPLGAIGGIAGSLAPFAMMAAFPGAFGLAGGAALAGQSATGGGILGNPAYSGFPLGF